MALHLVTGYKGEAHITAEDIGSFNAGAFGSGEYVLNNGNKFAAESLSSNTIKILDGDAIIQGRHITLKSGTYEEVSINNGEVGLNRNDLIVIRYTKDSQSGIEKAEFAVIQGTATSETATDPEYTKGDILSGDCTLHEMPLYRVSLSGLAVGTPEALFNVVNPFGEIDGLILKGTIDASTIESDTPLFWESLGGLGAYRVKNSSYLGTKYNNEGTILSTETPDGRMTQLFISTAGLSYRQAYVNKLKWGSWNDINSNIKSASGTYSGDGEETQFISLGFTPSVVFVARSDGSMARSHWGSELGTWFYGGLALGDSACRFWDGIDDHNIIDIVTNGFNVHTFDTISSGSGAGHIHTNDAATYYYWARN